MVATTQEAFDQFVKTITPSLVQYTKIENRRSTTHNYLVKSFGPESDMPLLRTVLIGSAAKGTINAPLSDIDVMAVFSNTKKAYESFKNAQDMLYKIRNALKGYRIETIGSRGQAVRLFYTDKLHVDIAPVFMRKDGGYLLPGGDGRWITTDPDIQISWFKTRNTALGGNLEVFVMLLKKWNDAHGKQFSSFYLETKAAYLFATMNSDYADALNIFFKLARNDLKVQDPAGHSGELTSDFTYDQWLSAYRRFDSAIEHSEKAMVAHARGDHKESIEQWQVIFGDSFPSYEPATLSPLMSLWSQ